MNQTRLSRGTSVTLPTHLLVGSPISLLRLIISGNRETTPIRLSSYLSFIVKFAFLFRLTKFIDYIHEVYVFLSEYSCSLVKNSCNKLSGVGVGAQKKRTSSFLVRKVGEGGGGGKKNTSASSSSSVIVLFVTVLKISNCLFSLTT